MAADAVLGDDSRRTLASGQQALREVWIAARSRLRRIFIVFVAVVLTVIYSLRIYIWPQLEADLLAQDVAEIVVLTPFDVILLQAKIGIIVGILSLIPTVAYYAREPLKRRGYYPEDLPRWKLWTFGFAAIGLFVLGVVYSYNIFFPFVFAFLAHHTVSVGLVPTYSLVDWTQFIFVLALSFGLAAQLPLVMMTLAYAGIVQYETFRDKWKYAILGMFGFGALFSPPDPFTQFMWAAPLVVLYGVSLYLTRITVAFKRRTEAVNVRGSLRANAHKLAGTFVLVAGLVVWVYQYGVWYVNTQVLPLLPVQYRPGAISPDVIVVGEGLVGAVLTGVLVGFVAVVLVGLYYSWPRFQARAPIDIAALDAAGVRSAPVGAFQNIEEAQAVEYARDAMDAGDAEKARAILDRFDEAEEASGVDTEKEVTEGVVTRGTTSVVNAVRDEETTEEEVGGYYYDVLFILDSLRSKTFRLFAVFMVVMVGVFWFLYQGGILLIKEDFLGRLPAAVRTEEIAVVTLHPVEALVWAVKMAVLMGILATIPFILYYAWPALRDRGIVTQDRRVFWGWVLTITAGLLAGSFLGYFYVAPAVVGFFVWDALQADMLIFYRVSNFFWLIFFTTVGIGLWLCIPVTMLMFHRSGIVSYRRMHEAWRGVTVGILAGMAALTPANVLSMVLVAIPVMIGYGVGLGVLWLYTLGERGTRYFIPESG